MKPPPARVTDHAVLRYLQRVLGVDVERHRRDIARLARVGVKHGASGVVVGKIVLKIAGQTVVTVVPACRPDQRTGRQRGERGGED